MSRKTAHHVNNPQVAHAAEMFSAIGTSLPVLIVMAKSDNAIMKNEISSAFPELNTTSINWMVKKLLDAHLIQAAKGAGPGRASYYYVHPDADRFTEAIMSMVRDL